MQNLSNTSDQASHPANLSAGKRFTTWCSDHLARYVFLTVAFSATLSLLLIALFILKEGVPFIIKVGFKDFLLASEWSPMNGKFGIYPMIISSLWVTLGAMLIGAPLGVAGAIFLTQFVPRSVMRVIKPMIELLAGIPSVLYGFIGVMILAPFIRSHFGGPGLSLLAASIILGIMVLPTVISISIDTINAVPRSYLEGALALGATRWQSVHMVILKAAHSGIIASVILAMGRAVGETMAVIMVAGNSVKIPGSSLDSVRTLTANIALEMGYATGLHRQALFATGVVLFVVVMILNSLAMAAMKKKSRGAA
ncbi:MAG: phosphate ABC transporter permease subunit PstC [Kiritimatiellaceae bacterium]|nr:phosphate ABC transporter permease subunit PstC [Kiritimatiellaceae bacterium]